MRLLSLLPCLLFLTGCVSKLDDFVQQTQPIHDATSVTDSGNAADVGSDADTIDLCANSAIDEGETATDCGGDDCRPCGLGLTCKVNKDCASNVCNGVCLAPSCNNGARDEEETDKDCGGDCIPCADGKHCKAASHCLSSVCNEEGYCEEARCDDTVRNGAETAVDCGGGVCDKCDEGANCEKDRDCATDFCKDMTCADPECGDGTRNGTETDEDCGGTCPACPVDKHCKVDGDCASQVCADVEGVLLCQAPTCEDGTRNQGEAAKDCGGPCKGCEAGTVCSKPEDCADLVCSDDGSGTALACAAATCDDLARNGSESDIDCGGTCENLCDVGDGCNGHADCESNSCMTLCLEPTCEDKRKNGTEVAEDCGGSCEGCGVGVECTTTDDCKSGRCNVICLPGGHDAPCDVDADCASERCSDALTCELGFAGDTCGLAADCASGTCGGDGLCAPGYFGAACEDDKDCKSRHCDGTCRSGGVGAPCSAPADCLTNVCTSNSCAAAAFVITTNGNGGGSNESRLYLQASITAPQVAAWNNLALLYFYHEVSNANLLSHSYVANVGQEGAPQKALGLAREWAADEWALVWRTSSTTTSTAAQIDYQVGLSTNQVFDGRANDYSYLSGTNVTNTKVVVCQRDGDRFKQVAGVAPAALNATACDLAVENCGTLPDCKTAVLQSN